MNKIITSLHKLPLGKFIDCLCDEDLTGLIIEGEPTLNELETAWEGLLMDYNDTIGTDGQTQYVKANVEYQRFKLRHDKAITYIELLNYYYKQEKIIVLKWIRDLNRLVDLQFKFNKEKPEELETYLQRCARRNKENKLSMDLVKLQLEQLAKVENKDAGTPDRGYFARVLINLGDFKKREITEDISTYAFCIMVNQLTQHVKEMEKVKR